MTQDLAISLKAEGLTDNEAKVLAVNLLPEYQGSYEKDKALAAGIDYSTYWHITRREHWQAALRKHCKKLWGAISPKVQNRYVALALDGDRIACERILQESGLLSQQAEGTTVNIYQQINAAEARQDINTKWGNVIEAEAEVVGDND